MTSRFIRWLQGPSKSISGLLALCYVVATGLWVNALSTELAVGSAKSKHLSIFRHVVNLGWWNLLIVFVVVLVVVSARRENRFERELADGADRLVTRIITNAAKAYVLASPSKHIRAIVTVCEGQSGRRRTRYTYNTSPDPERVASYPNDFGVTGRAFLTRSTVIEELSPDHLKTYEAAIQEEVLPELKSVMAAPLLISTREEDAPIGVLAFDSMLDLHKIGFDRREARDVCQEWADIVATLIHLKKSGQWPSI